MTPEKKILLIERDDFYIKVIETFVKLFLQQELVCVKSAEAGLAAVRNGHPHIILLDLDGHEGDALEFAERLRDDTGTKKIPIVAFSSDKKRMHETLGRGCDAFLTKPFKVRDLEGRITNLLNLP